MQFRDPVMISLAVPVAGLAAHPDRVLQRVAADTLLTGLPSFARRVATLTCEPLQPGRFIGEKYCSAAEFNDAPPHAVMPGDAIPGIRCSRNGESGWPRRPALRRAHPGRELAYTLVTSMITADRRSTERALLDECRHAPAAAAAPLICARAVP
jgi:hypothetical protein